jgi:2-polyprenyl-3-methyl-5-hydroxy-6-metoxy-1,4-benzoquinol methylase
MLQLNEHGFHELIEKPSDEELARYYAEKYYQESKATYRKAYSEEELAYYRSILARKARIVEQLLTPGQPQSPRKLLDIGCGEGWALAWFRAQGWQVQGVDFGNAGLMAHNPDLADRVEVGFVPGILQQRVQGAERYHLIWLDNVLEHVREPRQLVQQCYDLLAPGGVLVVEVPNDFSPVQRDLVDKGQIPDQRWVVLPDHLSYFNREGLSNLLTTVGLQVAHIQSDFPIDWFLYHPASNYYQHPEAGRDAHRARMQLEMLLNNQQNPEALDRLYTALCELGMGRQLVAFARKA